MIVVETKGAEIIFLIFQVNLLNLNLNLINKMSKNISKFKIFLSIIIFCISIIALILSCLVYTKKKIYPKSFTGAAGAVGKKGLWINCSANNECQSGLCTNSCPSCDKICMPPPISPPPYINVGDPIFIKSKNTDEDLWINSKSDPLLTTCKNLKGSTGLTISYGWPACTDPGTKSTVTIGSDGFRTGEGCQVLATPYCGPNGMPSEPLMCNLLTEQKRRLFAVKIQELSPSGESYSWTRAGQKHNFLWNLSLAWGNSRISRIFWNWPDTWRSRNKKPFAGVWVRILPRNCALNCFIESLDDCTCTDSNCWECRKRTLNDPCPAPQNKNNLSSCETSSAPCLSGSYDQPEGLLGWVVPRSPPRPLPLDNWEKLWYPKETTVVSDVPIGVYCSSRLDNAINKFCDMIFQDFDARPGWPSDPPNQHELPPTGTTRITNSGLYPFSQIWAHICQHAGIAIAFPTTFDSIVKSQEYFREYACMGGGAGGGGGDDDPFPYGGYTTQFADWMFDYAKTLLEGIGDTFVVTAQFMKSTLRQAMQKHASLIQEIVKIYKEIDEFAALVDKGSGPSGEYHEPPPEFAAWYGRMYPIASKLMERLQKLWVRFWMKVFQHFMLTLSVGVDTTGTGTTKTSSQISAWKLYKVNDLNEELVAGIEAVQDKLAQDNAYAAMKKWYEMRKPPEVRRHWNLGWYDVEGELLGADVGLDRRPSGHTGGATGHRRGGKAAKMDHLFEEHVRISGQDETAPEEIDSIDMWELGLMGLLAEKAQAVKPGDGSKKAIVKGDTIYLEDDGGASGVPADGVMVRILPDGTWGELKIAPESTGCANPPTPTSGESTVDVLQVKIYRLRCLQLPDGTMQTCDLCVVGGIWWYKNTIGAQTDAGGSQGNWLPFTGLTTESSPVGGHEGQTEPIGFIIKPKNLMRRKPGQPPILGARADVFQQLSRALLPDTTGSVLDRTGSLPLVLLAILLNNKKPGSGGSGAAAITSIMAAIALDWGGTMANMINQFWAFWPSIEIQPQSDNECTSTGTPENPPTLTLEQVNDALEWLRTQRALQQDTSWLLGFPIAIDPDSGLPRRCFGDFKDPSSGGGKGGGNKKGGGKG